MIVPFLVFGFWLTAYVQILLTMEPLAKFIGIAGCSGSFGS
jgi:hypothetical protein